MDDVLIYSPTIEEYELLVRCAVTLHALESPYIGCTCCHATWHVPHSTALLSTTNARQCSLVGTLSYRDSLLVFKIAFTTQTLQKHPELWQAIAQAAPIGDAAMREKTAHNRG